MKRLVVVKEIMEVERVVAVLGVVDVEIDWGG